MARRMRMATLALALGAAGCAGAMDRLPGFASGEPGAAGAARIDAACRLAFDVRADGQVDASSVRADCSDPSLEAAAENAVKTLSYPPRTPAPPEEPAAAPPPVQGP